MLTAPFWPLLFLHISAFCVSIQFKPLHHYVSFPGEFDEFPTSTTTTTTTTPTPVVEIFSFQAVAWDSNGQIMERPKIELRLVVKQGLENHAEQPTAIEILKPLQKDFDYQLIFSPMQNGVFKVRFRERISGKVAILFGGQNAGEEDYTAGYIEDWQRLVKGADPHHKEHGQFHGLDESKTHRILHLNYHNFRPFIFIYQLYGVVLFMEKGDPEPKIVQKPFVHIEYDSDKEHKQKPLPYKLEVEKTLGEFRITIRNGYGLDPEKQKDDPSYGKVNIAVASDWESFRLKHYRVYTIDVLEAIHNSKHNEHGDENPHATSENPEQILYLWADKDKQKYAPIPQPPRKHSLRFVILHKLPGDAAATLSEGEKGQLEHCEMPFRESQNKLYNWIGFLDEDQEEKLSIDNIDLEKAEAEELVIKVDFRETRARKFVTRINCGSLEADKGSQRYINYKSSFEELEKALNEGNAPNEAKAVVMTAPLKQKLTVTIIKIPDPNYSPPAQTTAKTYIEVHNSTDGLNQLADLASTEGRWAHKTGSRLYDEQGTGKSETPIQHQHEGALQKPEGGGGTPSLMSTGGGNVNSHQPHQQERNASRNGSKIPDPNYSPPAQKTAKTYIEVHNSTDGLNQLADLASTEGRWAHKMGSKLYDEQGTGNRESGSSNQPQHEGAELQKPESAGGTPPIDLGSNVQGTQLPTEASPSSVHPHNVPPPHQDVEHLNNSPPPSAHFTHNVINDPHATQNGRHSHNSNGNVIQHPQHALNSSGTVNANPHFHGEQHQKVHGLFPNNQPSGGAGNQPYLEEVAKMSIMDMTEEAIGAGVNRHTKHS